MFPDLSLPQQIAVWAVPVLLAITLHEVAHGWAARALGDPTAARLGRLSLNPLRHIDPVGTVIVPGVLLALGGFLFGWAKPVPVNMHNLRKPRQHMALVALAGPGANLLMAIGWALLLKLSLAQGSSPGTWEYLGYTAVAGVLINLVLMVLNLLPMPPLDGGRVLAGLVPESTARVLDQVERWGLLLLVALLATGILGQILAPLLQLAQGALFALVQMPLPGP
jgi:Zn-dependent protease